MTKEDISASLAASLAALDAAFTRVRRLGGGAMRLASDLVNAALLCAAAAATLRLSDMAKTFYANSGGFGNPRELGCALARHDLCMAYLQSLAPDVHIRLYWLALAWGCAVFACGCAVLTAGGLRWGYWRLHDVLSA
jgi:hypothetical protein